MLKFRIALLAALCVGSVSCSSTSKPTASAAASSGPIGKGRALGLTSIDTQGLVHNVRTTAYTHTESDHIAYGPKSAIGDSLKFGAVRSAAADWSVYPVGTEFKIEGEPYTYEVDDYGSALVGTGTIDLYRPSKASMNDWGTRHVNIKITKWGSFSESLAIMRPREKKAPHIRQMITEIESKPAPAS